MGDEMDYHLTKETPPSGQSPNSSVGSLAVRSVITAVLSCWPNTKLDRKDTAGVWANALAGLNGDQIRHGIRELSRLTDDFSPPPGKFRQLCETYRREPEPVPQLVDDSEDRQIERDLMRNAARALAQSLRLSMPDKLPPVGTVSLRVEQQYCEHDWKPHMYIASDYCARCGVLRCEALDAWRIDCVLPRNETLL